MKITDKQRRLSIYFQATLDPTWTDVVVRLGQAGEIPDIGKHFHDVVFLEGVREWQKREGLHDDGLFGRKCVEHGVFKIHDEPFTPDYSERVIRFAGSGFPVDFDVVHHPDLSFERHPNNFRVREEPTPQAVIWHWDVAMSSRGCFQTLLERKISIHFMVDGDGTVYQSLDLSLEADHTVGHDDGTIGIEANCPYWIKRQERLRVERPVVEEFLPNGNGIQEHLGFTVAQEESVVKLAHALSDHFGIPKTLPAGKHPSMRDQNGVCLKECLDKGFRGHAGHYHVQRNKMDPGTLLWPKLIESGFVVTNGEG